MNTRLPSSCFPRLFYSSLVMLALTTLLVRAQAPVDYNDVAVIINENSAVSREIGAYFAERRGIPAQNLIRIAVPERETIDDTEFQDLREQVETYLTENNLSTKINYLVTTKGVPIRVNRSTENETAQTTTKASVDNELTLILGQFANLIGNQGWATHNYVEIPAHFNRTVLPIYLVTRLDAYTKEDVFAMIDNSGPNTLVNKDSVIFVLDRDPNPIDSAFHQSQAIAGQVLKSRGWQVLLNSDSTYITGQKNVLGYASWGSNDHFDHYYTENAIPHNTWSPGALAETFVSTSARSLQPGTSYGQSLIADWLAEGVVGAKGYVFEPFTIALALPHVLFDRYTDESQDTAFNLAESFYMASRTLSWMDLTLGDPKTSIITKMPLRPAPILPPSVSTCRNEPITLRPSNISRGAHYWFKGDSATIAALRLPLDQNHPLWVSGGRTYAPPTNQQETLTYTYVNTNIRGEGIAQITVKVVEAPEPDFSLPADTVNLNEPVTFTDLTTGEGMRRWAFGDGTIRTLNEGEDPTYAYLTEGTFTVTLTIINDGCFRSTTKTIVVRSTTGVEEDSRQETFGLQVAPNPVEDQTVISMEMERPASVTVRIYGADGRLLGEEHRHSPALFQHSISLKGYPAGTYVVEVQAGEKRGTARLLRQ